MPNEWVSKKRCSGRGANPLGRSCWFSTKSDCIKTIFRDLKLGGYNLEVTQVTSHRLISIILLVTLAYSISTLSGQCIKQKGVAKYVTRPTEPNRFYQKSF